MYLFVFIIIMLLLVVEVVIAITIYYQLHVLAILLLVEIVIILLLLPTNSLTLCQVLCLPLTLWLSMGLLDCALLFPPMFSLLLLLHQVPLLMT